MKTSEKLWKWSAMWLSLWTGGLQKMKSNNRTVNIADDIKYKMLWREEWCKKIIEKNMIKW
jgi:hypothetical protein